MCVSVCLGTQKLPQPWECLALQACWRMKILFEKSNKCLFVGPREFFGGEGMKNYPVSNGDCKKPWSKDPVPKQSFFPLLKEASLQAFSDLRSSTSCKITMKFTEMTWQKVWSSKAVKVEWSFGGFSTHFLGEKKRIQLWAFIGLVFFLNSPDIPWPRWGYQKVFPPIFGRNNFWTKKKRGFAVNWQGSLGSPLSPKKTESPGCDEMVSDGMPLLQECCAKWPNMVFSNIWSNYSDLTRPHPKK